MNDYIWLWVVGLIAGFGVVGYFSFSKVKGDPLRDVDEVVPEEAPCEEVSELEEVLEMFRDAYKGMISFHFEHNPNDRGLLEWKIMRTIEEVGGKWKTHLSLNQGTVCIKGWCIKGYYNYNDVTYEDGCKVGDHYCFKGEYLTSCEWSLLRMFIDQPERFDINTSRSCGGNIITTSISIYDKDTTIRFTQEHSSVGLGDKVSFEGWKLIVKEVCLAEDRKLAESIREAEKAKEEKMLSLYCKCGD